MMVDKELCSNSFLHYWRFFIYCLTRILFRSGKVADWSCNLHDLQLSFGVTEFLVIAPQSASGVVLDAPEASKLLSAIAIALSNCSSLWPAFVPVHDPSRKAYIGIQNMGTIFTRRFEADRIGSQVFSPLDFSTHLFKVHFGMKLTYKTLPYDDDDDDDVLGADIELSESGENPGGDIRNKTQWDCDCPWSEWYSAEDPVKGFNLIAIWLEKTVESSLEMAELENASPHEAEKWFILPNFNPNFTHGSFGNTIGFASQLHLLVNALDMSFEAQFMEDFVSVENSGSDNLKSSTVIPPPTVLDRVLKDLFHEALGTHDCNSSCSRLGLVGEFYGAIREKGLRDMGGTHSSGGVQLPHLTESEHKSSRAIKGAPLESLFAQFCLHSLWFGNCNIRAIAALWIEFVREVRWYWEESQPLPRMPASGIIDLSNCLVNRKLHMLAICIEKKRQLSEKYQDGGGNKDHVSAGVKEAGQVNGDSSHTRVPNEDFFGNETGEISKLSSWLSCGGNIETPAMSFIMCSSISDASCHPETSISMSSSEAQDAATSADLQPSDCIRRGSAGVVDMMLLKSYQNMNVPFTQDAPLMTEDMHEERLHAVEALGDSIGWMRDMKELREGGMMVVVALGGALRENMEGKDGGERWLGFGGGGYVSAFKAANPDAVFEDFIRWHSPRDWEDDFFEASGEMWTNDTTEQSNKDWPPRGRLSQRMSERGHFLAKNLE
ncbi:hypothetical protein Acr_28g0006220 [Actinidia rufa]|uniref:Rab3 GTPase-activating protein catalytic subunit n=1 Tax=Actinidia rufa TaxID=165716 RepID=A0A7J0H9Y4_9ERIC|nr:hypothetical protein Acr_28g0006220 [Actinidia rufa]